MKHRENPKTVFLCSLQLEKIRTSRAYVRKSQYAKHGWDIVTKYIKRHGSRSLTKKHCLKSYNLT